MRHIHYIFILASLLFFASCGNSTNDEETNVNTENLNSKDTKYTDKSEGFTINFPGEPSKSSENIPIEGMGTIKLTDYTYTKDAYIYMVTISPQPTENVKNDKDKMSLLVSTKNGFCTDLQLNVTEEKQIQINNNTGIFLKANSAQYYAALSILFADSSLYQITILTKQGAVPDTMVESFINSFELIQK